MAGTGSTTIDFGSGSNEAQSVISGLADITSASFVEAWVMGDDTTVDHTANDHRYFPLLACLTCGSPSDGVGFTIYARSNEKLQGVYAVRWVWAN
jgi:hypothetical protein